jgi:hypothetical protein
MNDRRELAQRLRSALARYRGGTFESGGSGGAGGIVFFIDETGQRFYIGGFNPADAERIVGALNLTLELLKVPAADR